MLRLIGAILLMGGASVLGFNAAAGLRTHVTCLRSFEHALEQIDRELKFRLTPIPILFCDLAKTAGEPASGFFALCERGLRRLEERSLRDVWRETLEKSRLPLEQDEMICLTELGAVLGQYDVDAQRTAVALARERLSAFVSRAEEERNRLEKVYSALGLSAGAFMLLVLL